MVTRSFPVLFKKVIVTANPVEFVGNLVLDFTSIDLLPDFLSKPQWELTESIPKNPNRGDFRIEMS